MNRTAISRRLLYLLPPAVALALAGAGLTAWLGMPRPLAARELAALYAAPRTPPEGPLRVFHLGHSLVGRDMPAMLAQLAGPGHSHHGQIGWGTSLRDHWDPDREILGLEAESAHPDHRPAEEALASGEYDALVLTEMVEIRDAIRYHDSAGHLRRWIERARAGNPGIEIFLYETWHGTDDPDGWLERIDRDLDLHWIGGILAPALAEIPEAERTPVHLVPGGQVMAALTRRIEGGAGVPGLRTRADLFAAAPGGERDTIHFNDHGAYLVALTHFSVLYGRTPIGLPHELERADGTPMAPLSAEAARIMQETVWDVVTAMPMTGVGTGGAGASVPGR